jgi:hypothetical protein
MSMKIEEARVGTRVRTLVDFSGVPKGSEGVIDEDYGTGVTVAWDLPDGPLPPGYCEYDGRPAFVSRILRDGFDKKSDLQYLEIAQ